MRLIGILSVVPFAMGSPASAPLNILNRSPDWTATFDTLGNAVTNIVKLQTIGPYDALDWQGMGILTLRSAYLTADPVSKVFSLAELVEQPSQDFHPSLPRMSQHIVRHGFQTLEISAELMIHVYKVPGLQFLSHP
jgi:hypothetical protein